MCIGGFAAFIFVSACLTGFIVGPLLLAQSHADPRAARAAVFMRWYLHLIRSHFSEESFGPAYMIIQGAVGGILMYFIRIFIWIIKAKENERAERDKSVEA
jgi:hypothetical protein